MVWKIIYRLSEILLGMFLQLRLVIRQLFGNRSVAVRDCFGTVRGRRWRLFDYCSASCRSLPEAHPKRCRRRVEVVAKHSRTNPEAKSNNVGTLRDLKGV